MGRAVQQSVSVNRRATGTATATATATGEFKDYRDEYLTVTNQHRQAMNHTTMMLSSKYSKTNSGMSGI